MASSTVNIRPLSKELQKKAEEELNEDTNRIQEDLQHLKDWLNTQPHLTARQDDYFLLCFLRCCKFSLQKTKQKLDYFHTVRSTWSEFFENRNPMTTEIQNVLKVGAVLSLPQPIGVTGPRIFLVRWEVCNPSAITFCSLLKVCYMIMDILIQEDDNTIVSGVHFVVDYKNISPSYILQFTPTTIYRAINLTQSAYPIRFKGFDFINVPPIVDATFKLVKSFLNQKLKERAHSFSEKSMSDFYQRIPQNLFPKEYGGTTETVKEITDRWKSKVESYSQWFAEDAKYGSNEALRPEASKAEMFGADGTFRKLNID